MDKDLISEQPIKTNTDDILNRKTFVNNLVDTILNCKDQNSFVIGLFGKWGIGKTSVINMSVEELQKRKENTLEIVRFNPWQYSESDNLFEHFISEVSCTVRNKKNFGKLSKDLEKYLKIIEHLPSKDSIFTFVSSFLALFSVCGLSLVSILENKRIANIIGIIFLLTSILLILLKSIKEIISFKNKISEKTSSEQKELISKKLRNGKRKLLIIIDDIDRLSTNEIKQVFKIVRSNADFPNTIYLLSFDREIVEKSLDEQEGISGQKYLEKIINVDYELTEPSESVRREYLINLLKPIVEEYTVGYDIFDIEQNNWVFALTEILYYLKTIRDVKRFVNSIKMRLPNFISNGILEINFIDYFLIELLRQKFPEYYYFIYVNKELFLNNDDKRLGIKNYDKIRDKWYQESLSDFEEDKEHLDEIISIMFPAVRPQSNSYSRYIGMRDYDFYQRTSSICDKKTFEIYFRQISGLDDEITTRADMLRIQSISGDYNLLVEEFSKAIHENKIHNLLETLRGYVSDGSFISDENINTLLLALCDITELVPENVKIMPFFSGSSSVISCIYFLLKERDKNKNVESFLYVINKSKSIYIVTKLLDNEIRDYEKNSMYNALTDFSRLQELKNEYFLRVKLEQDNIIKEKEYIFIVSKWKEWANDNSFIVYAQSMLDTDENFLNLIDKFLYERKSICYTSLDKNIEKYISFDYKDLEMFGNLHDFKIRIENIKLSDKKLYDSHKGVIDYFLDNFDHQERQNRRISC